MSLVFSFADADNFFLFFGLVRRDGGFGLRVLGRARVGVSVCVCVCVCGGLGHGLEVKRLGFGVRLEVCVSSD